MADVSVKTINRNKSDWQWLDKCKAKGTRRATFNRSKVEAGLHDMNLI